MQEHVEDNSIPKDIPAFAKSFFVEATGGGFIPTPPTVNATTNPATNQPTESNGGGKRKGNGEAEQQPGVQKKQRNTSDKSLKMGLFHLIKGTLALKALPKKSTLKDGICLDFCCHERKCNFNHLLCKNGKHYTNWKNVPEDDRLILLKHMEKSGLMWLDTETFKKHENAPPSLFTSSATQPVLSRRLPLPRKVRKPHWFSCTIPPFHIGRCILVRTPGRCVQVRTPLVIGLLLSNRQD
jgi:hypothetical protein